jgi:hypothetical protein
MPPRRDEFDAEVLQSGHQVRVVGGDRGALSLGEHGRVRGALEERPVVDLVTQAGAVADPGELGGAVLVDAVERDSGDGLGQRPRGAQPDRGGVELLDALPQRVRPELVAQQAQRAGVADVGERAARLRFANRP